VALVADGHHFLVDLDSHTFGSCAFGGGCGVLVPDLVKWWFQISVAWSSVWFLGDGLVPW
jgi:hypothetical protein